MLKTFFAATAISALMVSGAVAQTATQSGPGGAQFVRSQQADQWLASKFKGTDVLGPNDEKVGDVNDVLFDKSGKVHAIIVGVGGFLGIGEKDVALEPSAFQVVPGNTGRVAGNTGGATSGSTSTGGANTGNTGTAAGTGTAGSRSASNDPADIKLKISMTKDQLKEAPTFERYRAAGTANTGNRATTTPSTTTPSQRQ